MNYKIVHQPITYRIDAPGKPLHGREIYLHDLYGWQRQSEEAIVSPVGEAWIDLSVPRSWLKPVYRK